MSYIRAGSNPEGLYVFGGIHGVEFYTHSANKNSIEWTIPFRHFREVCRRWYDVLDEDEGVKYGEFSAKTVWVDSEFKETESPDFTAHFEAAIQGKSIDDSKMENKVKLTWKGQDMYLWDVTWQYVVEVVLQEFS